MTIAISEACAAITAAPNPESSFDQSLHPSAKLILTELEVLARNCLKPSSGEMPERFLGTKLNKERNLKPTVVRRVEKDVVAELLENVFNYIHIGDELILAVTRSACGPINAIALTLLLMGNVLARFSNSTMLSVSMVCRILRDAGVRRVER
jgi:hypothetical protein